MTNNRVQKNFTLSLKACHLVHTAAVKRRLSQSDVVEEVIVRGLSAESPTASLSNEAVRRLGSEAMRQHKPAMAILNDLVLKTFPEEPPKH